MFGSAWLWHIYNAPGYYGDGLTWISIIRNPDLKTIILNGVIGLIGGAALVYAFMPDKYYKQMVAHCRKAFGKKPQDEKYKRKVGRLKLMEHGQRREPTGLSVTVRFVAPTDVEFAKEISELFSFEEEETPYEIGPIASIQWFENRSRKSRVVIYSDLSTDNWRAGVRIHGIVDAINDYNLLGEPVDLLERSTAEGVALPDFDVVIVVFPKKD